MIDDKIELVTTLVALILLLFCIIFLCTTVVQFLEYLNTGKKQLEMLKNVIRPSIFSILSFVSILLISYRIDIELYQAAIDSSGVIGVIIYLDCLSIMLYNIDNLIEFTCKNIAENIKTSKIKWILHGLSIFVFLAILMIVTKLFFTN